MSTTFPPRQAQAGQRITYAADGGTLRRLEAEEVEEGRWVIQPQTNGDEAAVRRHKLPEDREWAATLRERGQGRLTGKALEERGAELQIEGFSALNADQKRAAIADHEAGLADQDGAAAPSEEE